MSWRCDSRVVRFLLHLILFAFYWTMAAGRYPFLPGVIVFLLLRSLDPLVALRIKHPLWKALCTTLLLIGFSAAVRLLQALLAGLPLPWDLGGILFQSLVSLVILPVLLFLWISALSDRISWFYPVEAGCYAAVLALLLGNPSWNLELLGGRVLFSLFVLGMGAFCLVLLLLARGRRERPVMIHPEGTMFLLLLILVLVPVSRLYRSESIKQGGGLLESSLFHFDFSDFLSLESRISMKDELVFLMQKEGPAEKIYLRRFVLGSYDTERGFFRDPETTWETPENLLPVYRIPERPLKWEIPDFDRREWLEQTLYLINFDSSAFLGMNLPGEVVPYAPWEESSFSRIYTVRSSVSQVPEWELLFAPPQEHSPLPPGGTFLQHYTEYGDQEDLRLLAEEITEGLSDHYRKAAAIEEFLMSGYFYSLSPGTSPEGDQLRHFLYETKKGYCSYFAFSMTLLCRSVGIPARVALGFWVDTASEVLNFYPVNATQAHAWVEVFLPGLGWIEFDPTSQTLAPGETFEFSRSNPEELEPYIEEILANQENLRISDVSFEEAPLSGISPLRQGWERLSSRPGLSFLLLLMLILCLQFCRLGIALFSFPPHRRRIIPYYRIHRTLFLLGLADRPGDYSPSELAGMAEERGAVEFQRFTREYLALRFGRSGEDSSDWFRRGRPVRREFYRLLGLPRTLLLLGRMVVRPGRRL